MTINDCISLAEWDAMAPKIREALVQMIDLALLTGQRIGDLIGPLLDSSDAVVTLAQTA